jgi:hypothetical protein
MDYEEYVKTLESVGDSILEWADPNHTFRGHTEVRLVALLLGKVEWLFAILRGWNDRRRVRVVVSLNMRGGGVVVSLNMRGRGSHLRTTDAVSLAFEPCIIVYFH